MPLELSRPYLLVPALVLGALALMRFHGRGYYAGSRLATIVLARGVAVVALALAAAGPGWAPAPGPPHVVVLEDVSSSMDRSRRAVVARFRDALAKLLPPGGSITRVRFAARAVTTAPDGGGTIPGDVDPNGTDLEAALRVGMARALPGATNRIVLLSDGEETLGVALRAIPELQRLGIPLLATDLAGLPRSGFELRSLSAPRRLFPGEPFSVKALVIAAGAGRAAVSLGRDGTVLERREVVFEEAGERDVAFALEAGEPGRSIFKVELAAAEEPAEPPLSTLEVVLEVAPPPAVFRLTEDEEAGAPLLNVLRAAGLGVQSRSPAAWEMEGGALPSEGAVLLLDDVAAATLGSTGMERVEALVRRNGTGLLVVGGRHSLGAGGYRDTPLERSLPTVMGAAGKGPEAAIGLVLVVDSSFSMYYMGRSGNLVRGSTPRKIEIAKRAVIEVLRALRPGDRVGILESKDELVWIQRPGDPRPQVAELEERVQKIRALRGGINFYSSVLEASRELQAVATPLRMIMVVCDTNDIDQYQVQNVGDSAGLVRRMAQQGITLSIFAIGYPTDKDVPFLRSMASLGRGDFFLVTDILSLPRYLRAEYEKQAGEWFREGEIRPLVREHHAILDGLSTAGLPPVLGVDLLTTKPGATEVLATPYGTAFLSLWGYGKGRTAVFAADSGSRWGAGWSRWSEGTKFWRQLIYRLAPRPTPPAAEARAEIDPGSTSVAFRVQGSEDAAGHGFDAVTIERDGERLALPLERTGLDVWTAPLPPQVTGRYSFRMRPRPGGKSEPVAGALEVPPSAEGRIRTDGADLLELLVRESGGSWITAPADALAGLPPVQRDRPDPVFWLLLAALLSLLGEFLLRYE